MGWVNRQSNDSCVETAEKPGDELQPLRIDHEGSFAVRSQALEPGSNCPRSPVQICIGQMYLFFFPIPQERICQPIRLVERPPAQDFNQSGWFSFHVLCFLLLVCWSAYFPIYTMFQQMRQ